MSFFIGIIMGYTIVELTQTKCESTKEVFLNNRNFVFENEINYINKDRSENINKNNEWKVVIPKIELEANIRSGTSKEILNEFVGHFEETKKLNGNIGLAAHNRGYNVNYFEKIKYLEIGDEILYSYSGIERKYTVITKNIIEDTNWKMLENTKDNRITLITCVENKPKYRLCVQGIEK